MEARAVRSAGVRSALFGLALICVVALLGLNAMPAWGQAGVNTGTIVGQVLDPSGASVAGATVTITDKATGAPRTSTTTDTGRYVFTEVPLGTYDITVTKDGFSQAKIAQPDGGKSGSQLDRQCEPEGWLGGHNH